MLKALSDGLCDVHYQHAERSLPLYLSLINILFASLPDIDLTPEISTSTHTLPFLSSIIMLLTQHCLCLFFLPALTCCLSGLMQEHWYSCAEHRTEDGQVKFALLSSWCL